VKALNQPRVVPNMPSASAVEAALQLMVSLGSDNKTVRRLLCDLKSAIEHNERLVKDAAEKLAALSDLEQRAVDLAAVETRTNLKIAELQRLRDGFKSYERTL